MTSSPIQHGDSGHPLLSGFGAYPPWLSMTLKGCHWASSGVVISEMPISQNPRFKKKSYKRVLTDVAKNWGYKITVKQ